MVVSNARPDKSSLFFFPPSYFSSLLAHILFLFYIRWSIRVSSSPESPSSSFRRYPLSWRALSRQKLRTIPLIMFLPSSRLLSARKLLPSRRLSVPVSPLLSRSALRFPRSVADFPQSNTVLCPLKILLQRLSKRRIIEFVQRQANNSLGRETVPVPLFFFGFSECRCSSTRVCWPWTRVFQLLRDDIQRRRELVGICRG